MSSQTQNNIGTRWPQGLPLVDKSHWQEWFDRWFDQMGVRAQSLGVEKLQSMVCEAGIAPHDNLLSRGIIDMRQE